MITLGEAYRYAYDQTVSRTVLLPADVQHPTYDYKLAGQHCRDVLVRGRRFGHHLAALPLRLGEQQMEMRRQLHSAGSDPPVPQTTSLGNT